MKLKRFCKKNGATILLIAGCIEFGAALWAMRKAAQKEQDYRDDVFREDAEPEPIELAKIYAPVAILTVGSLACFVGGHVLSQRKLKAMSMAYSVLNNRFMTYRNKVNELFGPDADEKVKEAIAEDEFKKIQYIRFDDKQMFYDGMLDEFFWSTKEEVKDAIYAMNRTFTGGGYPVSVNDWLMLTERETVPWGDDFGWSPYMMEALDGAFWIDFQFKLKQTPDGKEFWYIQIPFEANNMYNSFCGDSESYERIDKMGIVYASDKVRQ